MQRVACKAGSMYRLSMHRIGPVYHLITLLQRVKPKKSQRSRHYTLLSEKVLLFCSLFSLEETEFFLKTMMVLSEIIGLSVFRALRSICHHIFSKKGNLYIFLITQGHILLKGVMTGCGVRDIRIGNG